MSNIVRNTCNTGGHTHVELIVELIVFELLRLTHKEIEVKGWLRDRQYII